MTLLVVTITSTNILAIELRKSNGQEKKKEERCNNVILSIMKKREVYRIVCYTTNTVN